MNASPFVSLFVPVLLAAGGAAHAFDGDRDGAPVPLSTLSRAEVIADLQVWQQSGMTALADGEASPDAFGQPYRTAQARYLAMRASPEFTLRVARIARERGDALTIAGQ